MMMPSRNAMLASLLICMLYGSSETYKTIPRKNKAGVQRTGIFLLIVQRDIPPLSMHIAAIFVYSRPPDEIQWKIGLKLGGLNASASSAAPSVSHLPSSRQPISSPLHPHNTALLPPRPTVSSPQTQLSPPRLTKRLSSASQMHFAFS